MTRKSKVLRVLVGSVVVVAASAIGVGAAEAASPPAPVTCGSVIAAPGQYRLAGDCTGAGITIVASDVTLLLDHHTMDGGLTFPDGIAAHAVSRVHIEGPGSVTRYQHAAVVFDGVTASMADLVSTTANGFAGVLLQGATGNQVTNNEAGGNVFGFLLLPGSIGNELSANEARANAVGIALTGAALDNRVNGNRALGNFGVDLADSNPNCDANTWEGNIFDRALAIPPDCIS